MCGSVNPFCVVVGVLLNPLVRVRSPGKQRLFLQPLSEILTRGLLRTGSLCCDDVVVELSLVCRY